jgi:esterase/lipase
MAFCQIRIAQAFAGSLSWWCRNDGLNQFDCIRKSYCDTSGSIVHQTSGKISWQFQSRNRSQWRCRTHTIRKQMLDSLAKFDLGAEIEQIIIPHLIFHSPADETLDFQHADDIFSKTNGAKSMVTLVDSDHLFVNRPDDVTYVSDLIAIWAKRFLD